MRCAQRCRNRPDLDAKSVRNRSIVEIGVVAEEQHFPLPLWQGSNPRAQPQWVRPLSISGQLNALHERLRAWLSSKASCLVDNDPPHPSLQRTAAAEGSPLTHSGRERRLHRVATELGVTANRAGDAREVLEPRAVELLELRRRRPFPPHAHMSLADRRRV